MKPPNEMAKFDVYDSKNMAASILQGDRAPLARAITLMESNRPEHRALARAILKELRKSSSSAAGMNPSDLSASSDEPALNTEAGVATTPDGEAPNLSASQSNVRSNDLSDSSDERTIDETADPTHRLDHLDHGAPADPADPADRLDHLDRGAPADPGGRAYPSSRGGTNANELEIASTQEVYSYRVGITGVPGVGKSSFIEKFGLYAIEKGHRVAVLAIDPTSALSKGSILGDKTRMSELSQHPNAYIRPTATGGSLGGVARATRESMLLLEAAGFDFILVETVGVGQSEITVAQMVDFFLLLMLPGAGDDLQGIKRGIMEMADLLVVNKADGDRISMARKARASYAGALHLFPPKPSGWIPRSEVCSAIEGTGVEEIYNRVLEFYRHTNASGFLQTHRREQEVDWFNDQFQSEVMYSLLSNAQFAQSVDRARASILNESKSPYEAVAEVLKKWSLTPSSKS